VDAPAEREEGDRQAVDEDRAQDEKVNDRLDRAGEQVDLGRRRVDGLGQLGRGKCGDEDGACEDRARWSALVQRAVRCRRGD
jgi:hypothetical protein